MAAVVLLVVVALGARLVWELLKPLVPMLLTLVVLALVYAVVFGKLRR